MTADEFSAIAIAFPKAASKPHFDRIAFHVDVPRGKTFATLAGDGTSANLVLSIDEQGMVCGAEPGLFAPVPNKWGEKGWTTLQLGGADEATARSALTMAWRNAAPEKLHDLLDML